MKSVPETYAIPGLTWCHVSDDKYIYMYTGKISYIAKGVSGAENIVYSAYPMIYITTPNNGLKVEYPHKSLQSSPAAFITMISSRNLCPTKLRALTISTNHKPRPGPLARNIQDGHLPPQARETLTGVIARGRSSFFLLCQKRGMLSAPGNGSARSWPLRRCRKGIPA